MHDGITFEQYGKPAVVLCTEPFVVTARNIARMLGLPEFPFVVLDHPIGSLTDAQLARRAESAFDQALPILLTDPSTDGIVVGR